MRLHFRDRFGYLGICLLIFVLDQLTKAWVMSRMVLYQSVKIVPGFLNLTYIHNKGVIFGIFSDLGNPVLQKAMVVVSISSFVIIAVYFFLVRHESRWATLAFALVLGGALGNTWDRLTQGFVVDFLDFYYGPYHWPTFNLADAMITVGICMLLLHLLGAQWHGEKSTAPASGDEQALDERSP